MSHPDIYAAFAIEICCGWTLPASSRHPDFQRGRLALVISHQSSTLSFSARLVRRDGLVAPPLLAQQGILRRGDASTWPRRQRPTRFHNAPDKTSAGIENHSSAAAQRQGMSRVRPAQTRPKTRSDHLPVNVVRFKAGAVGIHQESGNATLYRHPPWPRRSPTSAECAPEDDAHFSPLMTYSLPTFAGARSHMPPGFDPELGLVQTEAAELITFLHRWQPGFFLAGCQYVIRIHAQSRLNADETAHAGIAALSSSWYVRPYSTFPMPGAAVAFGDARRRNRGRPWVSPVPWGSARHGCVLR